MASWGVQEYKIWPGASKTVKRWGNLRIICADRRQALDMMQVLESSNKGGIYRVQLVDKPITHGVDYINESLRKTCSTQQAKIDLLEMKVIDLKADVAHYRSLARERQVKVNTMLKKFRKAGLK